MRFLIHVLLFGLTLPVFAQQKAERKDQMTTYYVAFLKRGPAWTADVTAEVQRIQEGHIANIRKMSEQGKLVLAGPFTDNTELRGMFVFQVGSLDEAKALCGEDPAVKAGRLACELHPWLSPKGIMIR